MVFEGEVKVNEKSVMAHEMVYVPRGEKIKMNCIKKTLVLELSNKCLNGKDFMQVAFAKAMKDPVFGQNLTHSFLFSNTSDTDELFSLLE
jgi:hypothetical protein